MIEFIDRVGSKSGTPINRSNLMGVQGFQNLTYQFIDGKIIEKDNTTGYTLTTTFNSDGSIKQTFVGEKEISKTTKFLDNGDITEVLS